jgi:hypothetical protein
MRVRLVVLFLGVLLALPGDAAAQGLDTTCQFSLTRLDATTTNVLAVDTNAVYWGGTYAALPGTRIRIEGQYPHSRYIGWNVYDAAVRPIDALADIELAPDPGSSNPFLPGASRTVAQRDYTAFIEVGPRPEQPAPNTLYTGSSGGGTFLYRVYVPDRERDAKGGVPLPKVTLEPAAGAGAAPRAEACRELQAPYAQPLNDLIAGAPGLPDPTDDGNGYPGRNPPRWSLFENLCGSAIDVMLDNEDGEAFHPGARGRCGDGPGFLSNRDIAYVFTGTSRGFGDVLVLRGRAPTFAHTRPGPATMPGGQQLRYWSFCQYEPATQRVIACRSDDRVVVGPRGFYRIVVSTADDRPRNARRACGVSWLPWGPQTQGLLIYRHMLADPAFAQAIQNVGEPGREREVMRGFYPDGRYLATSEDFERRGCRRAAA